MIEGRSVTAERIVAQDGAKEVGRLTREVGPEFPPCRAQDSPITLNYVTLRGAVHNRAILSRYFPVAVKVRVGCG